MDRRKAKSLTLKAWRYLAAHPGCRDKSALPKEIYASIEMLYARCPLCEYFSKGLLDHCAHNGERCPIFPCVGTGMPYTLWLCTVNTEAVRKEAAQEIVRRVEAWEVK